MSDTTTTNTNERTLWQRLATTPMRDIIRGRASGRLDLTIHSARHGLPRALADLVVRVARRTRLRSLEKADVARELAAHFAEGVAQGKTTDQLIESFGDPAQAAKLIRRAKKRNRPLVFRAAKRTTLGALAAFVLLYTGVIFWYLTASGEVNPTHDYLADLNARAAAVPERDRAWPRYREALLAMGEIPKNVRDCKGPHDYRWPEAVAWLDAHQDELAQLRRAAAMPGLGYIAKIGYHEADLPLVDPEQRSPQAPDNEAAAPIIPLIDALLPQIGPLRRVALLFQLDARRDILDGAHDRAIENIEAIERMALHADEHGFLISQLVRISLYHLAVDLSNSLLHDAGDSLTGAQLDRLSRFAGPDRVEALCAIDLTFERLFVRDVEQHLYTDNGRGNGRIVLRQLDRLMGEPNDIPGTVFLEAPTSAILPDRASFRERAMAYYDDAERLGALPLWQRHPGDIDEMYDAHGDSFWGRLRFDPVGLILPAVNGIFVHADTAAMQADALRTAVALHQFKRDENTWPSTLDQLVPRYLDTIPPDRFTGRTMGYTLDETGQPILYSAGADLDDDRGKAHLDDDGWPTNEKTRRWRPPSEVAQLQRTQSQSARNAIPDADYILYPPLPEKPVEPTPDAH